MTKCQKCVLYIINLLVYGVVCNDIANFKKPDPLPKYFGIDIDGTFLVQDTDMMKKNIEAFKKLKTKNITPFFCTGGYVNAIIHLMGTSFDNKDENFYPGVYFNGALVYDSNKNVLYKQSFNKDFIKNFIKFVIDNNFKDCCTFFGFDKIMSLNNISELVDELTLGLEYEIKTKNEIENEEIFLIRVKKFDTDLGFGSEGTDYIKSEDERIRAFNLGSITKLDAIRKLLENIGGNTNELAYIGDGRNDICVLELNDVLSFAVNNAKNEVKQKAKWVVDLNYDQGAFAKVVELLLKAENSHL